MCYPTKYELAHLVVSLFSGSFLSLTFIMLVNEFWDKESKCKDFGLSFELCAGLGSSFSEFRVSDSIIVSSVGLWLLICGDL